MVASILVRSFVGAAALAALGAQQLVRDIGQGPPLPVSPPYPYDAFGNASVSDGTHAFFPGLSHDAGIELWTSDGTVAGTRQVSDLWPGAGSSGAVPVGLLGSRALVRTPRFYYRGPGTLVPPFTYWASDGTTAGTSPIMQLSGSANAIGQLPNALLLLVSDLTGSTWLARTDLTAAGTQMLGNADATGPAVLLGTQLLWGGSGGLWHSDGTSNGSGLLASVAGTVTRLVRLGNFVFFLASGITGTLALWRSDGTANGTVQVFDTGVGRTSSSEDFERLAVVGGRLLLLDGATPTESAWLDNGTATALQVVVSVTASTFTSTWSDIASDGTRALFTRGNEVWTSDGTPAGTRLVATLPVARHLDSLHAGFVRQGRGILQMGDSVVASDGTAGGTFVLPSSGNRLTLFEQVANGVVFAYERATGGLAPQLAFTDGTVAGTVVLHTATQPPGILGDKGVQLDDALLAALQDSANGVSLWRSDGTAAGTFPLRALGFGPTRTELVAVDGAAFFTAANSTRSAVDLWRTDGTVAGTSLLHAATSSCYGLRIDAHGLFFCDGTALWHSDGTAAGTARTLDIGALSAPERTNAGVFVYPGAAGGMWRSDGTAAGTFGLPMPSGQSAALGDRVIVVAQRAASWLYDVWATDGSIAGTANLVGINPVDLDPLGNPHVAVAQGRGFVIAAAVQSWPVSLVVTDGTIAGTTQLPLPVQFAGGITAADGKAWFVAGDGNGAELWVRDGTAAGTHRATDVAPGLRNGVATIAAVGDGARVFLGASDGTDGLEPYVSDGTAAGTRRIADIAPNGSSNPQYLGLAAGRVFFLADDGVTGQELWSMPLALLGNASVEPLGRGCAGSAGVPELSSTAPHLGQPVTFTLQRAPAVAPVVFAFASQRAPSSLASGCVLQLGAGAVTALALSDLRGTATRSLAVPSAAVLVGASLTAQAAALDPFGTALPGLATSNGLRVFVGR